MQFFDQVNDRDFSQLRRVIEGLVLQELMTTNPGVIISKRTSLPEGFGFIRQIMSPLQDMIPRLPALSAELGDLFGPDTDDGPFADDLMARAYRGMMPVMRRTSDPAAVRIIIRQSLPCGDMDGGYFPLHNPVHQLLSLLYAAAQNAPEHVMAPVRTAAETTFGPATTKTIIDNVTKKPVEIISNLPDITRGSDGMPEVATFMPALLTDLVKINYALKGKLDPILKEAVDKYRKGTYITVTDRDFQKKLFDTLEGIKDPIAELTVKPAVKVVYNSVIPASSQEILKVNGTLIDLAKVKAMGYSQACVSLSKQVADYIYDEKKENVVPEQFIEMVERLSSLTDIPPEDRKELDDRVLGPISNFFRPDDIVVDKLMDKNGNWKM